MKKTVLFFLFLTFYQGLADNTFKYVHRVEGDPELEKYLREAIENFREQMKDGIEAIGMPVLDPLELKDLEVSVNENLATLNLQVRKFKVFSLSKFNLTKLVPDLEEFYIEMNMTLPVIHVEGHYSVDGKLAKIFPIYGKGQLQVNATKIDLYAKGKLSFTNDTIAMNHLKLDFIWGHLAILMENFLGGGDFSEVLQRVVPDLGKRVFILYKPKIVEKLVKSLTDMINEKLDCDFVKDIIKGAIPHF